MTTLSIPLPSPRDILLHSAARRFSLRCGLALVRWSSQPAPRRTGAQQAFTRDAARATERARGAFRYGIAQ